MENRSKAILGMEDSAFARSLFKSMGYTDSELKEGKPLIGIANTWNTLVPGHYNLDKVAEYVKNGIYAAGGTAVEFGTIAACDGVAQGHEGMHYILPSREIICDSVEIMAQAHRLDGLVLLASCDKIVPAMLMAAARLDIPCIVCVGGPMLGGIEFDGRKSDLTSISEALGMLKAGKITECEYNSLENTACPGCGSCSFLGTANTMCCVSEALGMTLPGGALIPAAYAGRLRHSFESGRAIVELCKKGITARQILTKEAIRNAIKVTMAICGSTNAVLHLPAIANEAELDMNVLEEFEALTKTTPQIAKVNPAAKPEMEAFYRAGGIPRVMQHLGGLLDTSVMTVSGKTLAENLAGYVYEYPEDPTIIKTVEEPFSKTGGVAVLHGNLCPRTAVSKPGAIDPSMHHFVGKAKCYNSEEEAEEAILGGKIQAGDVVVIRYEGPKGGPGMREMFKAMKYMYGVGLSKSAALITDGRFSGTNNGCFVGHISPEAAEGGPLAIVHDGDEILIPEPFYPNYNTMARTCGAVIHPVSTSPEEGYFYADRRRIEAEITPRTRAILVTNPGNPTGTVLTHEEMEMLVDVARQHDLFLIGDEAYREFVYAGEPLQSFGEFTHAAENVILIDTVSKRFSACGARIGCLISRNRELMAHAMKYAQCRLAVPTLDQLASAALYQVGPEYFAATREEYKRRRDTVVRKLQQIPGVVCECPKGAFYLMAALPVDDADTFQQWLLEEFEDHGDTVMFAPGEPFYGTPGKGKNEIRIAYVLKQQDLERAMDLLALGIRAYQQR